MLRVSGAASDLQKANLLHARLELAKAAEACSDTKHIQFGEFNAVGDELTLLKKADVMWPAQLQEACVHRALANAVPKWPIGQEDTVTKLAFLTGAIMMTAPGGPDADLDDFDPLDPKMGPDEMSAIQTVLALTRATIHIADAADVKYVVPFMKFFGPNADSELVKRVAPTLVVPCIRKSAALKTSYDDMMVKLAVYPSAITSFREIVETEFCEGTATPTSPSARASLAASLSLWGAKKADCRNGSDTTVVKILQIALGKFFDEASEKLGLILEQRVEAISLGSDDSAVTYADAVMTMMGSVASLRFPGVALSWMQCKAKAEKVKPMVAASESEEKLMPLIAKLTEIADLAGADCQSWRQELMVAIQGVRAPRDPDKPIETKMTTAVEKLFQHLRDLLFGAGGTDQMAEISTWVEVLEQLVWFVPPEGKGQKKLLVDHVKASIAFHSAAVNYVGIGATAQERLAIDVKCVKLRGLHGQWLNLEREWSKVQAAFLDTESFNGVRGQVEALYRAAAESYDVGYQEKKAIVAALLASEIKAGGPSVLDGAGGVSEKGKTWGDKLKADASFKAIVKAAMVTIFTRSPDVIDKITKDLTTAYEDMVDFAQTFKVHPDDELMKKTLETINRLKCSTAECRILAEIEASQDEAALSSFVVKQQ
ncbi:unnamed protein product, partial [Prorocentrum cordatum]